MYRSIICTLCVLAVSATLSPSIGADLDVNNIPSPFAALPIAADSPATSYNSVLTMPTRLVPERDRGAAGKVGISVLIDDEQALDFRPVELLRPSTSRMGAAPVSVSAGTSLPPSEAVPVTPAPALATVDEARARRMIVAAGYFGIQELYQDESGNWEALAMPVGAGTATKISIDREGNLTSKPTLAALGQQTASR